MPHYNWCLHFKRQTDSIWETNNFSEKNDFWFGWSVLKIFRWTYVRPDLHLDRRAKNICFNVWYHSNIISKFWMCHEAALECLKNNTKHVLYPLLDNLSNPTTVYWVIAETDNHAKSKQPVREIYQNTGENGWEKTRVLHCVL